MSSQQWHALADALLRLELGLRALGLWSDTRPAAERLNSPAPFCVDTLTFEQWLQWVFIPRLALLINQQGRLPAACNIMPMAQEALAPLGRRGQPLLGTVAEVDRLASLLVHR
ncbi:YqcC family protein [Halopseudomonas sp.]|uniref:YqcC family protein n=1 Tax=Halopseudomonas sp. TaxID=2901191 RepID=UPI00300150FC